MTINNDTDELADSNSETELMYTEMYVRYFHLMHGREEAPRGCGRTGCS